MRPTGPQQRSTKETLVFSFSLLIKLPPVGG
jgi:hypothetical protein